MLRLYLGRTDDGFEAPPLSSYREKKLEKLKNQSLRGQMLRAEALLVRAVRDLVPEASLPLEIITGEKGKPQLRDLPLFFNLSHSDALVACALADHEIGLDLQGISKGSEALLRRFFSERERRYIWESPCADEAFTRIWTLRESYVKATGEGLSGDLTRLAFDAFDPPVLGCDPSARFWTMRREDYFLSVCSLNGRRAEPENIIKES